MAMARPSRAKIEMIRMLRVACSRVRMALRSASEKLNETWQAVSTELYKAAGEKAQAAQGAGAQGQPGAGPQPGESKKDDGPIIDAEVVDEKK